MVAARTKQPDLLPAAFTAEQEAALNRAAFRFGFSADERQQFVATIYAMDDERRELMLCASDPQYFIEVYCEIYDPQALDWIPFELWQAQLDALNILHDNQLTIALKARQLGMTWLGLAYGLWLMLFRPIATVLIFSKRDDEAMYLLGEERLRGMYLRLPKWMQAADVDTDNASQWQLSNGSVARSFPTTGGDGYTATFVLADEADLLPDFNRFMRSVKPTIDAGGRMFLVSRADKSKPESEFKRIYKAAKEGRNGWAYIFLPWYVRPERDQAWYEAQKADILSRTGSLDDLKEQYPATDEEALSGRSQDKRINPEWLSDCYDERRPLSAALLKEEKAPSIPGLCVYHLPIKGRRYCGGGDPAEGNPGSDDSAVVFLDELTGEEVAMLSGKFQPSTFAAYIDQIGKWLNNASLMIERNNHGHAVLLWLRDNSKLRRLNGWDADPRLAGPEGAAPGVRKEGWLSNSRGKTLLYDALADTVRDGLTTIHSFKCHDQIASIEGSTLRAPENQMDDCSDAYALAVIARNMPRGVFVG